MHYLGHYGNLKALRTFTMRFGLDLTRLDVHGQSIIHYAARRGELGIIKYLNEFKADCGLDFNAKNNYNMPPVVYAMINQKFYTWIYLYFKMNCTLEESTAVWCVGEMVKLSPQTEILSVLLQIKELRLQVMNTALAHSIKLGNLPVLKYVLENCEHSIPEETLHGLLIQLETKDVTDKT